MPARSTTRAPGRAGADRGGRVAVQCSAGSANPVKTGDTASAGAGGEERAAAAPPETAASPAGSTHHRDVIGTKRRHAARVAALQQQAVPKHHRAVRVPAHKVAANSTSSTKAAATETASEQPAAAIEQPIAAAEPAAPEAAVKKPDEVPPVHATLKFKNEASDTYKLAEARFTMDGAALPTVLTSVGRGQTERVFSGDIPAGRHVIAAHIVYHGADRAVFTYIPAATSSRRISSITARIARSSPT